MFNRKPGLLTTMLAAMGVASLDDLPSRRVKGPNYTVRKIFRASWPTSKSLPHQSNRECARRCGGSTWEAHKAMDRYRRGLPVQARG